MKYISLAAASIAALGLATAASAEEGDNDSLTITGSVAEVCDVNFAPGTTGTVTLADPSSEQDLGSVTVTCNLVAWEFDVETDNDFRLACDNADADQFGYDLRIVQLGPNYEDNATPAFSSGFNEDVAAGRTTQAFITINNGQRRLPGGTTCSDTITLTVGAAAGGV